MEKQMQNVHAISDYTEKLKTRKALKTLDKFNVEEAEVKIDFEYLQKQKAERQPKPYTFNKDKNYTNVSAGMLNMSRIADSLKNPTTLLIYLLQWKGYAKESGDYKKGVTGDWYRRGFIVASQSEEQCAVDLEVSERTIRRWIKALERDRLLVIEKNGLKNVYVLGLVDEQKVERYFYCGDVQIYRLPAKKGKK